jgi:predicted Rdx family selenoprotein
LQGHGFDADAISGKKGQFDVDADGRVIFSKDEAGRFPDDGEVLAALEALRS